MGRLSDGRAVFVPYALPGEEVRVCLEQEKRGYARARLVDVLVSAPERISPRCRHFTVCGGCQYQHMPYSMQLEVKAAILSEQLRRICGLIDPLVEKTVPCPSPWNYRNHVQFHLNSLGKLGFQARDSQEVISIEECHLPDETISQIWPLLEIEPLPGLERISLRSGVGDEGMLILESSSAETPAVYVEELPVSVVHLSPGGSLVLAGSDFLEIEVLGRVFRVSAASFFQVNTAMAGVLVRHILDHLSFDQQTTLLEVYCGVGLFSAFLAPWVGRLVGIEASPSACEDFEQNLQEFDHVTLYEAPAEVVLPSIDFYPEIILVDPPRAGLGRRVLTEILRLHPAELVYVSCDPSTLARDARQLIEGGYRLRKITPLDVFPQTYHIESISFWEKNIPS